MAHWLRRYSVVIKAHRRKRQMCDIAWKSWRVNNYSLEVLSAYKSVVVGVSRQDGQTSPLRETT